MTEIKKETLSVNLSLSEAMLLLRLLKSSKDDPRIHGLIGTCFWFHSHSKSEERDVKNAWTSLEQKLEELKLNGE